MTSKTVGVECFYGTKTAGVDDYSSNGGRRPLMGLHRSVALQSRTE